MSFCLKTDRKEVASPLPDSLETDRVGRDGSLELAFAARESRTVLVQRRFRLPLQTLEPVSLSGDGSAVLYVLNPTGGLLAGDRLKTHIVQGTGTHVVLTTPSATRVYRSDGSPTLQRTTLEVGPGATLEVLPDHLIPHPGAFLRQSVDVSLAATSRLLLYDAFALGRIAREETWRFRRLESQVRVLRQGTPLFWDHLRLEPETSGLAGWGHDGGPYIATLVGVDPSFGDWEGLVEALHLLLGDPRKLRGGASPLARDGFFLRFLARSAYELTDLLAALWTRVRRQVFGLEPLDLRKG